jgi:16S rRNA (guanine527-N7)-methyltransferase
MQELKEHFPNLTDEQYAQFEMLPTLYQDWNEKINVVSRKDIEELEERHILHSLGIAKVMSFKPGTKVMDVGTGGGFPGIPLAILFPETDFLLIDSIGKKIKVVESIAESLGLKNVRAKQMRAEKVDEKFDFVVSRAVTQMPKFTAWVKKKFLNEQNNTFKNGILYLKGGDLRAELNPYGNRKEIFNLSDYYKGSFFETKKVVYIRMTT